MSDVIKFYSTVSVPSRGTTFPNLLGLVVFEHYVANVSVPSRGTTFPNKMTSDENDKLQLAFPSPLGELHFQMLNSSC